MLTMTEHYAASASPELAQRIDEAKRTFTEPTKTVTAYKLFRAKQGKLYPLFIAKTQPTPTGEWIPALHVPTKGFAERPGWHAGALPTAPHLRGKDGRMAQDRVWAEVEMPADQDWQSVADASRTRDIRDRVPEGGHYHFKTNKMQGGAWKIGGAIKVKRILHDHDVAQILHQAGEHDATRAEQHEDQSFFDQFKDDTPAAPEARYTWYCDFLARVNLTPRPFDEWRALQPERYAEGHDDDEPQATVAGSRNAEAAARSGYVVGTPKYASYEPHHIRDDAGGWTYEPMHHARTEQSLTELFEGTKPAKVSGLWLAWDDKTQKTHLVRNAGGTHDEIELPKDDSIDIEFVADHQDPEDGRWHSYESTIHRKQPKTDEPARYIAASPRGWMVELDGELARYDDRQGQYRIGEPVPEMVNRVKQWLAEGRDVRIFTARLYGPDAESQRRLVDQWCRQYIGRTLPITAQKDPGMYEFWDDRAIQVLRNTGRPVGRYAAEQGDELEREDYSLEPLQFETSPWEDKYGRFVHHWTMPAKDPGENDLRYLASSNPIYHPDPLPPGLAKPRDFSFSLGGTEHPYDIANTGNAQKVFAYTSGLAMNLLGQNKPAYLHFSASMAEPSRQKLYRAMLGRTPQHAPDYRGYMVTQKGNDIGQYFLVHKDHAADFENQQKISFPYVDLHAVKSKHFDAKPEPPVDTAEANVTSYSMTAAEIDEAVKDWSPPTEAQAEAGNYPKVKVPWNGLTISIENPAGTRRKPEWPPLKNHYGYFNRTLARDSDQIDVFLGPSLDSDIVFVVDQEHPSGRYDEPKVLIGWTNAADAKAGYLSNYQDGWHCGPVTAMTLDQFRAWLEHGDTTKRVADQVSRYTAEGTPERSATQPTTAMNRYYRIQPSGNTSDHLSESSAGETTNLHVFESPLDTIHAQEHPTVYGDEVVEIEAPRHWDNQDVEGVAINPAKARVTRRWNLHDFPKAVYPFIAKDVDELSDDVPLDYAEHPAWHIAQNIEKHYGDLDQRDRANERQIPAEPDPDRYAARHKPQAGQRTLHFESAAPTGARKWTAADEALHPRDETGEFAPKETPTAEKPVEKPAADETLAEHVANLHDAMQQKLAAGRQFLARHDGRPLWIPSADHLRVSPDKQTIEHTDPQGRWVRADLAQLDHWAERANLQPFTGPEGILTTKESPDAGQTAPGGPDRESDRADPAPDQPADDRPVEGSGPAGPGDRTDAGQDREPERLKGGEADGRPDSDFDPETLAKGTRHEMEHTTDHKTASEIARDHLVEDPAYYEKLATIEGDQPINQPHEPPEPEAPEVDDSEPPEEIKAQWRARLRGLPVFTAKQLDDDEMRRVPELKRKRKQLPSRYAAQATDELTQYRAYLAVQRERIAPALQGDLRAFAKTLYAAFHDQTAKPAP